MKNFRLFLLILLGLILMTGTNAQGKKKPAKPTGLPIKVAPTTLEPEVVAKQDFCGAEEPFVFVARDRETYLNVQKRLENAPAPGEVNFERTAVIVAFAGTKPNPGHGLTFKNKGKGVIQIGETAPPRDAMLPDVLASPCAVALVPIDENTPLKIEVSQNLTKKAEVFRIKSGDFTKSGGFAGISEKFQFEGTISVWKLHEMLTFSFDLRGKGKERKRILRETASGTKQDEDNILLAFLEPHGFVQKPFAPLKVIGTMKGKNLSMIFEPLPTTVADGFELAGKLEAVR